MTDRWTYARAYGTAARLASLLAPACERIEIAGSLRRRAPQVKDIEIVAMPRLERDLFGNFDPERPTELDQILDGLERSGRLARRLTSAGTQRWGPRYRAAVSSRSGIPIDLFLVLPPAQWGAILAIRTGPAEYSQGLVTAARDRGLRCEDGRLVRADGSTLATPEERDFIEACGVPWAEPEHRR